MNSTSLLLASSKISRFSGALSRLKPCWSKRNYHQLEQLPYPIQNGLGDFLPPEALKVVAIDYQGGLLQQLNEELRASEEPIRSVTQIVLDASQHREKSLAFNYASLTINNDFFLRTLKPPPNPPALDHQSEISLYLASAIRSQHGSLAQLKSSFCAAALGMFTSGWIWFVTDKHGNTGVIPTFGPGTLLVRSRSYIANAKDLFLGEDLAQLFRGDPLLPYIYADEDFKDQDGKPLNVPPRVPTPHSPPGVKLSPASGVGLTKSPTGQDRLLPRFYHSDVPQPKSLWEAANPAAFDRNSPRAKVTMLNVGEYLTPLFCVSVNEHAWMSAGYGVWGKEEWLKKFWTVLDWKKVSSMYEYAVPNKLDY